MNNRIQCERGTVCRRLWGSGAAGEAEPLLARDIMQCGVVSIDRKEPVQKAVMVLIERHISGLPVVHEGRLDGMLSEKDLLQLLYESQYLPGLVEDYMTCGVTSVDVETELPVIHQHLVERSFRRVPVLHEGRIAGMITRADLVRVYKERLRPVAVPSASGDNTGPLAEDAMRCGLLTVGPDTPLYEAMDLIARHHVTGLPVVDGGMNLLGIFTEKDALEAVDHPDASGAAVEMFMTREVVAFHRKARLDQVCACLIDNGFHRVPVLEGTRLVGIISRSDILRHRAATFKR